MGRKKKDDEQVSEVKQVTYSATLKLKYGGDGFEDPTVFIGKFDPNSYMNVYQSIEIPLDQFKTLVRAVRDLDLRRGGE